MVRFQGAVTWYTINLDSPPSKRWTEIITDKKKELVSMVQAIRDLADAFVPSGRLEELVDRALPMMIDTLPYPFNEEMKGIATASGVPLGEVILFNIFYEIFTVCTSLVAEDPRGILEWILGKRDGRWMSFLTRSVLENAT
ncbi:acid ceramidase-like, partial [Clarias magur]